MTDGANPDIVISPQAGDLVFCHDPGIVGKAIRLGEWLRFRRGDQYNHVAIVNEKNANGSWTVIQAEARGVTDNGLLADIAPGGTYELLPLPPGVDAEDVRRFALAQVGRRYGFVTIASIVASIISPAFLNFMRADTWICSAVSGESLRFGGWLHGWANIYQVTPSQLWDALTVGSAQAIAKPPTRRQRLWAWVKQQAPGWINQAIRIALPFLLNVVVQAMAKPKRAAAKLRSK